MSGKSIGIVGGGIMGMTLALNLSKEGHRVTLFEAAPHLGGLANAWEVNGFTWDRFYHVILMSDTHTRSLLKELELDDKIDWKETKTGFYTDGKLYSMSNTIEFLTFPPLNLIDKFRLGLTILVASKIKNWERLESIPVSDWLKKWSGKRTFEKIWLPLLRAKLGDHYKETSAAFIWATIQRMYAARRSGLKKEMFGYVQGGYSRIIEKFKDRLSSLGVVMRTSYQAQEISMEGSKPVIRFINGHKQVFDKIVTTLPSGVSGNLCKGLLSDELEILKKTKYLGVICASIVLKRPISNYYVTNITDTWVPFTGVIEMSALVDKAYFNGNSLVYLPKYLHQDDPLFKNPDAVIEKIFQLALKKMYSLKDEDIICTRIARAKNVFALSTLDYSKKLASVKTSMPDVYILNSSQITNGTLNVNETIRIAKEKLGIILNN